MEPLGKTPCWNTLLGTCGEPPGWDPWTVPAGTEPCRRTPCGEYLEEPLEGTHWKGFRGWDRLIGTTWRGRPGRNPLVGTAWK